MGGDEKEVALVHAPLTVRPTPFPRASFEKAKRAATVFNTLIDRVSREAEYLQKTLALAAEHDDFTVRLPSQSLALSVTLVLPFGHNMPLDVRSTFLLVQFWM